MLVASEILPMIDGRTAPPRMAITWREEPRLVSGPRFLILSAKIVEIIMEWKNPISTKAHTDAVPPAERATIIEINEPAPRIESRRGAATVFISAEPPR